MYSLPSLWAQYIIIKNQVTWSWNKTIKQDVVQKNKDVYFDFIVRVFDWYSFFTLGLVPKQARPLAPEDERQRPPGSPLHGLLPDDVAHVKLWVHGPHDAPAYVPRTGGSWPFCPSWSTHFTIDYVTESETELTSDPTPPNTRSLSPVHASVPLWNVFTVLLQLIVNFKRVLYFFNLMSTFSVPPFCQ